MGAIPPQERKEQMKKALLTMGVPGAGKSYVLEHNYDLTNYTVIDPDAIKKEKADYSDDAPSVYHEWSKKEAEYRIATAIYKGDNIVIDGTGTNVEKMYKRINELQANGYMVEVLFVKVKLQTALKRNQERPRTVPEWIIYEKHESISTAFEIVAQVADVVTIILND